jgi:general secretion pathway protein G
MPTTRGFTVLEMMVVLTVMSLLALATVPVAELIVQRTKERELKAALVQMRAAIDAYKQAYEDKRIAHVDGVTGYPPSLQTLVDGVPGVNASAGQRLFFLRRVPADPFAEPSAPAAQGWGLRSYASSADRPTPGADVYDVYSLQPGTGLDGVAYREW